MSDRNANNRGRGGPRSRGGPSYGYESPYPSHAMDNPYAEDADSYRNGYEYNQFESPLDSGRGRPPRRDEEKVHDPLIEERLQRERPCRTLFIRNIKYETDSHEFRHRFEEFGEIKTFFDLISHRGMVFCTYYDMRAAERAKERLQGTELAGRPIDVHYSLPRDDQKSELNQGVIIVTLIESTSKAAIDDTELRRKLTTFGDVKSIHPNSGRHDSRVVEFYDLRSAEEAHGKLRHQSLQDGIIETEFAQIGDPTLPPGPAMQERARQERPVNAGARGRGRGGRGRGRGMGGYDDRRRDWEEDDYYGRSHPRMSPPRYEERWRERSPPPRARSNGDLNSEREKLEQAKKVQDLLAALKQTGATGGQASGSQAPSMYYAPPVAAPGTSSAPFGLPPNLAHLGALLQQAAQLPPQQAQAAATALQQYPPPAGGYPGLPPSFPNLPPQSSMYPGSQNAPPAGAYGYPPGQSAPPPGTAGGYPGADIYSALQKQAPSAQPSSVAPPDSARYNYPQSGQQAAVPPPPTTSSIQDIMALLKRPNQS